MLIKSSNFFWKSSVAVPVSNFFTYVACGSTGVPVGNTTPPSVFGTSGVDGIYTSGVVGGAGVDPVDGGAGVDPVAGAATVAWVVGVWVDWHVLPQKSFP